MLAGYCGAAEPPPVVPAAKPKALPWTWAVAVLARAATREKREAFMVLGQEKKGKREASTV